MFSSIIFFKVIDFERLHFVTSFLLEKFKSKKISKKNTKHLEIQKILFIFESSKTYKIINNEKDRNT